MFAPVYDPQTVNTNLPNKKQQRIFPTEDMAENHNIHVFKTKTQSIILFSSLLEVTLFTTLTFFYITKNTQDIEK